MDAKSKMSLLKVLMDLNKRSDAAAFGATARWESAWQPREVHPRSGATGIWQIHRTVLDHWRKEGKGEVDLLDPWDNYRVYRWYRGWLRRRPWWPVPPTEPWIAWAYVSGPARIRALLKEYPRKEGERWGAYVQRLQVAGAKSLALAASKLNYVKQVSRRAAEGFKPFPSGEEYKGNPRKYIRALTTFRPSVSTPSGQEPMLLEVPGIRSDAKELFIAMGPSRAMRWRGGFQRGWMSRLGATWRRSPTARAMEAAADAVEDVVDDVRDKARYAATLPLLVVGALLLLMGGKR